MTRNATHNGSSNTANDIKEFWPEFNDESDLYTVVECEEDGNLASAVLSEYSIDCASTTIGGSLPGLDIKHMDAMQVIRLSLLEYSAKNGGIYEPMVNNTGSVEFRKIGQSSSLSDIYYEIQTSTYTEACTGVMVTGGKPLAERKAVTWTPIWDTAPSESNAPVKIYNTGIMHNSCIQGDFNQYCTIVFNDPHLDTRYKDGIDNLYEINENNPWDQVLGYARYIWWPNWKTDKDTTVELQSTATVLVKLPTYEASSEGGATGAYSKVGTLQERPKYTGDLVHNESCFEGQGFTPEDPEGIGVKVPLEEEEDFRFTTPRDVRIDNLLGISNVYAIGREIFDLRGKPRDNVASVTENSQLSPNQTVVWASIEKAYDELFALDRGKHYVVAYKNLDDSQTSYKEPYIVFANNKRYHDPAQFGEDVEFYIDPYCSYYEEYGSLTGRGTILPTSDTTGILVKEIWVAVNLDVPSIVVYNPDGWNKKAEEVAGQLEFQLAPMVLVDRPAPIVYQAGTAGQGTIEQQESIVDHDPTTKENFTDTEIEKVLDKMDGGNGMTLSMSFLTEESDLQRLADSVYDYLNSGSLGRSESTYICGPNENPQLGYTAPCGGTINSITYSYQDSNSYTISVNAGPRSMGNFAQIEGGPSFKKVDSGVSSKGVVIQDMGNHVHFKVRLDELGDRVAINMCPEVIRVGDIVQCSVHNNPAEI